MAIEDGIDFFHIDALASAVAMKVNCDLQLTLMASSLYRLLGARIGNGYQHAQSRHLFRDFVEAAGHITITEQTVVVHFQKRRTAIVLVPSAVARYDWNVLINPEHSDLGAIKASESEPGYLGQAII